MVPKAVNEPQDGTFLRCPGPGVDVISQHVGAPPAIEHLQSGEGRQASGKQAPFISKVDVGKFQFANYYIH